MRPSPLFCADLLIFTKEILNKKPQFLCCVIIFSLLNIEREFDYKLQFLMYFQLLSVRLLLPYFYLFKTKANANSENTGKWIIADGSNYIHRFPR